MKGPAGVLAFVLAETVTGGAAFLFLMPLWNEVRPSFFKLSGVILLALTAAMWASVHTATQPLLDSTLGSQRNAAFGAELFSILFAAVTVLWVALVFFRGQFVARVLGFSSLPFAVLVLAALAATSDHSDVLTFIQLLAGSALLGVVIDGLLLGHWYLTDRKLTRAPINRFALALVLAVAVEAAAVIAAGFGPEKGSNQFSAILTAAGLAPWIAIGMIGTTALIAAMIRVTLRGPRPTAVQAATGFFYLAVITAFAGEMAAKVRFLR
jgi:hypothetical protein